MNTKILPVVLIAVTVLLAGCTGGIGSGAEPTTTSPTTTTTPGGVVVDDPASAVRAAGSVTVEWSFRTVADDGTVESATWRNAIDFGNERNLLTILGDDNEETGGIQQFYADDTTYMRIGSDDGEPFYTVSEGEFDDDSWLGASHAYDADDIEGLDDLGTETFDGTTVRTYETTDTSFWWWAGGYGGSDADEVESFVYTVKVDDDGLVRYEAWSVTTVDDEGLTETVEWEYSVTGIGSTVVEEPDWLDDAIAQGEGGS